MKETLPSKGISGKLPTRDVHFMERMAVCASRTGNATRLSEMTGISRRAIGEYMAGNSEPGRSRLISIAAAAGVHLEWLATGEGPMAPAPPPPRGTDGQAADASRWAHPEDEAPDSLAQFRQEGNSPGEPDTRAGLPEDTPENPSRAGKSTEQTTSGFFSAAHSLAENFPSPLPREPFPGLSASEKIWLSLTGIVFEEALQLAVPLSGKAFASTCHALHALLLAEHPAPPASAGWELPAGVASWARARARLLLQILHEACP